MIRESGRRHGPIFGRVRAHWRPLEKATARSDAAGPPECPRFLSMKRRPAGHDVRICRAFVTLSGYVPGHSIRAAPDERACVRPRPAPRAPRFRSPLIGGRPSDPAATIRVGVRPSRAGFLLALDLDCRVLHFGDDEQACLVRRT